MTGLWYIAKYLDTDEFILRINYAAFLAERKGRLNILQKVNAITAFSVLVNNLGGCS
jgi:hypothetical protein